MTNDDPADVGLIGAVEGGGTKFVAAVARQVQNERPTIEDLVRVPTSDDPSETLDPIAAFLTGHSPHAVGIACFGPLDLASGTIRSSPKPHWSGVPVQTALLSHFENPPPSAIDTDVNGAVLAEWTWGAASGAGVAAYVTVGTGIGGGAIIDGRPLHGLGHPEMGHVSVPRYPGDDQPNGCSAHEMCLEGMAAGPALRERAGQPIEQLAPDDPLWDLAVHYLAHGLADLTVVLSPEVIVLGGGVMQQPGLVGRVAARLDHVLAGYVDTPGVVEPAFGQEAGLYGAIALGAGAIRPN